MNAIIEFYAQMTHKTCSHDIQATLSSGNLTWPDLDLYLELLVSVADEAKSDDFDL